MKESYYRMLAGDLQAYVQDVFDYQSEQNYDYALQVISAIRRNLDHWQIQIEEHQKAVKS